MKSLVLSVSSILLWPLITQAQDPNCDACKAVLAGGVFNATNINQTQASKDAFTAWECTTNFSDAQEAMNSGVSVGVPVYDVPIQIGVSFSDDQRKTWKSSHCSNNTGDKQSFSSLVVAMKQAAPEILQAWTACIQNSCSGPRAALACSVAPKIGGALFNAKWEQTAGDTSLPKVEFFRAYDATCNPLIRQNQMISAAGVTLNCAIPVNKEAVFILQTNRGTCAPTASGRTSIETFTGKQTLSAPKNYKAEKIVFNPDAILVTNGKRLTLEAHEIELQGAPQIISFEPGTAAGQSAGAVLLKADVISGTSLSIENTGEQGADGLPGVKGPKGPKGPQGTQRDWNPFNGCIGGSNGKQGGQGGTGGDGNPGQAGGNGGTVIFDIGSGLQSGPIKRLVISTTGGKGGAGGAAGAGGDGGDGGDGAPGTSTCGGTGPGPAGPPGAAGRPGQAGGDGAVGALVDYRATQ